MGFKHVEAALQAQLPHQIGIDMGILKAVLVAICQHASNDSNYCFPSARRLARMTHYSKSTCAKAIEYLNCMGCFLNYAKGGGRGSSSFIIDLERLQGWAIDWNSVRETDTQDGEIIVPSTDTDDLEKDLSVPSTDVASPARTSCPSYDTQRPQHEPNLSFDRSGNPSKNAVIVAPPSNLEKPNQSTPDCSFVASATATPKPKCRLQTFDDYDDDGNPLEQAKAAVASSIDASMSEL